MTRFALGVLVGVVGLAFVQFMYAPLPTSARGEDSASHSRKMSVTQTPDVSPEDSVGYEAIRPDAPSKSGGLTFSGKPSVGGNENKEPESDTGETRSDSGIARNPIELPATHAGFVEKTTPSLPDEHSSIEQEEVNPAWAELMQMQILSHVASHPKGQSISIVSLVCRTTRCEIAGTVYGEQGGDTWNEVLGSMQKQAWFAANFAPSMSGAGAAFPGEYRFLSIFARVGTQIEPPVEN